MSEKEEIFSKLANWIRSEIEKEYPGCKITVFIRCDGNMETVYRELAMDDKTTIEVQCFERRPLSSVLSDQYVEKVYDGQTFDLSILKDRMINVWCRDDEFEIMDPKSFDKILEISKTQYKRVAKLIKEEQNENQ